MNTKEKAIELVKKFKDHVNPYIGSGMLSNTYDDNAILWQSKKCAIISIDSIIDTSPTNPLTGGYIELYSDMVDEAIIFWKQVKSDVETLTIEDVA